ncbi:YCII-related domain-containing protein [Micromonospora inyonensis]|uniref:YCII-related domain-containing protein n=2 Tax=Micromonospora inyonensis TaxID=47866 RepID=A0A1C6RBX1_9ACTN|nr:YCII-related domain-containing protein [Micromonospora inyonensis]
MRDVGAVDAEMRAAGVWVFAGGLHPPSTATVVRVTDGELLTTDGPYAEGKEHLGGFTSRRSPGRRTPSSGNCCAAAGRSCSAGQAGERRACSLRSRSVRRRAATVTDQGR